MLQLWPIHGHSGRCAPGSRFRHGPPADRDRASEHRRGIADIGPVRPSSRPEVDRSEQHGSQADPTRSISSHEDGLAHRPRPPSGRSILPPSNHDPLHRVPGEVEQPDRPGTPPEAERARRPGRRRTFYDPLGAYQRAVHLVGRRHYRGDIGATVMRALPGAADGARPGSGPVRLRRSSRRYRSLGPERSPDSRETI